MACDTSWLWYKIVSTEICHALQWWLPQKDIFQWNWQYYYHWICLLVHGAGHTCLVQYSYEDCFAVPPCSVCAFAAWSQVSSTWFPKDQITLFLRNKWAAFYIHVTVHRNKSLFNNQPDTSIIQIYSVIKLYMFRASCLPIIRSFLLYIRHW